MKKGNILVILTGGTICSAPKADVGNKNQSNATAAKAHILADFAASASPFASKVSFDTLALVPDILSENITLDTWNRLVDLFRSVRWEDYSGVIVLHGTDTLAYTACLLSMLLAGTPVPTILVSSQLPLTKRDADGREVREERTNGYANFRAAIELIENGIAPNVYAVYRNMDGKMLLHYGAHLLQCPNYSNDFHSYDETELADAENARFEGHAFGSNTRYFETIGPLTPSVLLLVPYIGLDYARVSLDGVRAVVHGTYHSDTVCVERKERSESFSSASVLSLINRCRAAEIPLFLAPCDKDAYAYASTGDALDCGASYIPHTTLELAYVKTLIGTALGHSGTALEAFLRCEINHERLY